MMQFNKAENIDRPLIKCHFNQFQLHFYVNCQYKWKMLNSSHLIKWNVYFVCFVVYTKTYCVYLTIFVTVFKFNVNGEWNEIEARESKKIETEWERMKRKACVFECVSFHLVNFTKHCTYSLFGSLHISNRKNTNIFSVT